MRFTLFLITHSLYSVKLWITNGCDLRFVFLWDWTCGPTLRGTSFNASHPIKRRRHQPEGIVVRRGGGGWLQRTISTEFLVIFTRWQTFGWEGGGEGFVPWPLEWRSGERGGRAAVTGGISSITFGQRRGTCTTACIRSWFPWCFPSLPISVPSVCLFLSNL